MIGFTIPYASLASDFVSRCFYSVDDVGLTLAQSTYLPTRTPKVPLFFMVYFGLLIPLICIPIFGAAAYVSIGPGVISYALTCRTPIAGCAGRTGMDRGRRRRRRYPSLRHVRVRPCGSFRHGTLSQVSTSMGPIPTLSVLQVLFAISVTANTAPTIYSCGLSSFVVFPFLAKSESCTRLSSFKV
jgi:hypothetical protein